MSWELRDRESCFPEWAAGKSLQERALLQEGLAELVGCPLAELPGERWHNRSPMHRWAVIGSTFVSIFVVETKGVVYLIDLEDF